MTSVAAKPRRFLTSSVPVRLAWQATNAEWLDDRSLRVDVRAERFEPSLEALTGVPSEIAAGPVGESKDATLQVDAWSDHVIRVRWNPSGEVPDGVTPMLVGTPKALTHVEQLDGDSDGAFGLRTGELTVRIEPDPIRLVVLDKEGAVIAATRAPDHEAIRRSEGMWDRTAQRWLYLNRHAYPLGSTEGAVDQSAFVSFELRPDERVYGFGESFGRVEKTGLEQRLWTAEAFTNTSPVVYKPVPFCLSTRGYGIYLNSSHAVQTHIGDLDPTALSWIVEDTEALDFFIVVGPALPDVLRRYTDLTGTPAVPPRWTLGLWLSRCTFTSQDEVLEVAREARERDIPADVMHIDTGWFEDDWVCDWRFGSRFPDPAAMVAELRDLGFAVTLWQWPYVGVDSPAFAEARDADVLVRRRGGGVFVLPGRNGPDVGVIDYSNPAAVRWLEDRLRPLLEMGIAGIKADFGEAAPADGIYANIDSESAHNAYPLLYNRAVWEASENVRGPEDTVIWARSAWAGSQRYPLHWSGDGLAHHEDLACVLRAGLSMGLSGFPFYSHDIGGFMGLPSPELYVRWAQLGLFSSHARTHGLGPREPWAFGPEAEAIVRRYAQLRYELMPYLWSEALECGRTSLPMVRHLVLAYPDDPTVRAIEDEYLLGGSLLVAPVLDDRDARDLYLPHGKWVEWHTGRILEGGCWKHVEAPLDVLPLYLRGGSVIPMGPRVRHTGERPLEPLRLLLPEPAEAGSYVVRDPGGDVTVAYTRQGQRLEVNVSGALGEVSVEVPGRSVQEDERSISTGFDGRQRLRLVLRLQDEAAA
jgi:alpha-D-xyloside xylohydrolase